MKVVWNTCDKELDGSEMKSAYETYLKSSV